MKNEKRSMVIIFGVSFLLGCMCFGLSLSYQQQHDALVFIKYAQDIASGGFWNCGMDKEPGYPMLIAPFFMFFSNSMAIILCRLLNIILFSTSAALFYLIIRILFSQVSAKRTIIFSLIFALSPQLLSFSSLRVYSEPLQLFLNSLIIFSFVKLFSNENIIWDRAGIKYWLFAGLAMGWLVLTKSFFILYPLWLALFIFLYAFFVRKVRSTIRNMIKSIAIFLCLSLVLSFFWSVRNYRKYGYFMLASRGALTLLGHAYLVDWGLKDAVKWSTYKVSDNLGKHFFPSDSYRMNTVTCEPNMKSTRFIGSFGTDTSKAEIFAIGEWRRLVKAHPFRYVLFYFFNFSNHILFEGIYPDIFPVTKSGVVNYLYVLGGFILHFLYSLFIWLVIVTGFMAYIMRSGIKALSNMKIKYAIILFSWGYFVFFAYHFHTEPRYFYPFYINIYLLFALSFNYLSGSIKIFKKNI